MQVPGVSDCVVMCRYQVSVESGNSGDSGVELSARHYETIYLSSQTGAAIDEVQNLVFNSVVQAEVQVGQTFSSHR